jgi:hypothetical protein
MTNNNIWDCADMRPMISAKWSIDDGSVFYIFFFFVFLVCTLSDKSKATSKKKRKKFNILYLNGRNTNKF